MSWAEHLTQASYLAAAALFILSLRWLSAPKTARRGVAAGGGITHHRVEHARQLEIRRHLDTGQGDESDSGIVDDPATEQVAQLLSYLIADAVRSVALRHYVRYSTSDREISPGSRRSISSAAAASSCST